MNLTETTALLNGIALYDNREVDLDLSKLWHAHLAGVAFTDAAQAVHDHFDETSAWIMPSDVMNRIRERRSSRIAATHLVYDGNPDETPEQYLANIRKRIADIANGQLPPPLAQALGQRPVGTLVSGSAQRTILPAAVMAAIENLRPEGLESACPVCRAKPGKRCVRNGNRPMDGLHPSRQEAVRTTNLSSPIQT